MGTLTQRKYETVSFAAVSETNTNFLDTITNLNGDVVCHCQPLLPTWFFMTVISVNVVHLLMAILMTTFVTALTE
jgi:hypothetical protein